MQMFSGIREFRAIVSENIRMYFVYTAGSDSSGTSQVLEFRAKGDLGFTQRLHGSSFLGLPYRIQHINPKKELLWSLRVG